MRQVRREETKQEEPLRLLQYLELCMPKTGRCMPSLAPGPKPQAGVGLERSSKITREQPELGDIR